MNKSLYRPEIDGLRAVAVISVLLYHVGVESISGGFVGVDVFFVISGYLITRLLKTEIAADNFSYGNFYIRRARRLFPALFVTLFLSFIASFWLLSPDHLERFSGALIYAITSLSNFYFWQESGYFDIESGFKPLLHTWSLSVEEQFYMIWPFLLVTLIVKKPKWLAPLALGLLGIASLVLAEWLLDEYPEAVFFLTPFRVVEFVVGASLVWLEKTESEQHWWYEILCWLGFVLIAYATFFFDHETRFPGLSALIPSIGAALVIYAGRSRSARFILANPLSVRIGLISYSLYLVHGRSMYFTSTSLSRRYRCPGWRS